MKRTRRCGLVGVGVALLEEECNWYWKTRITSWWVQTTESTQAEKDRWRWERYTPIIPQCCRVRGRQRTMNSLGYRVRDPFSESQINFPHIYQAKTTRNSIRKCCTSHKQHVCRYTCYLIDTSEVVIGWQGPSKAGEEENTRQPQKSGGTGAGGAFTETRERHKGTKVTTQY